jgi:hypothetical protein
MDRRRRRFQDLERRREEFAVAEVHAPGLEPRERAPGERLGGRGRGVGGRDLPDHAHAAISVGWL